MPEKNDLFAGSIAEHYHRYLVPLIFDDYARDLAEGMGLAPGSRVLEIACGTGALTRHVRRVLEDGTLVSTDLNPAMVEAARGNLNGTGAHEYQQADGTQLPFEDDSFDLVICQFGVMFYPEKARGYAEAARVLKPGGAFRFNVWDSLVHNGLAAHVHAKVVEMFPDDPPEFLALPFGYFDIDQIKSELQAAGFGRIDVTVRPRESRAPSATDAAMALIHRSPLGTQLAEMGLAEQAFSEVESSLIEKYGDGEVRAPMQAIEFTARIDGAAPDS